MRGLNIKLPECGLFLGSGIYPTSGGYLLCTLFAHQSWIAEFNTPQQMIDRIVKDNQGNLAQFWGAARGYAPCTYANWLYALDEIGIDVPLPDWENKTNLRWQDCEAIQQHADRKGAGILRFINAAAKQGIYTALIYTDAHEHWSRQFQDAGEHYLGYDFGERFTFRFEEAALKGKPLETITLDWLADDLIDRVKKHVDIRHATGWGNVMATSINFYIDYEIVAGADIPVIEDFAFSHLNFSSALSRGLYRQFDLPLWGSHLAHEHYSWIPLSHPRKFDLFKASMYLKYMAGCKMIINESGNWHVEGSLCEDSPKFNTPRVPLQGKVNWGGNPMADFSPYIEAAREHFPQIGYDSPVCKSYRKEISDFYDFVKANGTPAGQPESTIALAKGNYDLSGHRFAPNAPVGGAYALADANPAWLEGAPEYGWEIVKKVFFPLKPVLEPQPNRFLSGTPFGMADIVTFAKDQIDAGFLSANYKALLFSGWNTASDKQYEILKTYVAQGGTLFLAIPHLSKNVTRNYASYGVDELVNQGDFSELCGVKVKGRGQRIYWATAPDGSSELGFRFPRRFGIIGACLGNIEITDPHAEVLVVDDEQAAPVVIRRKLGQGWVYFLNTWAYPGSVNTDEGPGAVANSYGLIGTIYRHIASRCRGKVWITDDGREPAGECEYITFSYFPEAGTICLYNIDAKKPHPIHLHHFGKCESIEVQPGEFRMIQTQKSAPQPGTRPNVTLPSVSQVAGTS